MKLIAITIALSVLTIVMASLAFLALLDIAQGKEPDLTLEWLVVWVSMVVINAAQVGLIVGAVKLRKSVD